MKKKMIISGIVSLGLTILLFILIVVYEYLSLQEYWWYTDLFKSLYGFIMFFIVIAIIMVPLGTGISET